MKFKKRYKFRDWLIEEDIVPPLFSLFLLWSWKRNKYIQFILLFPLSMILQLGIPFVYLYFLLKELNPIVVTPLFLYFFIGVWMRYFRESADTARDISKWRRKK